MRWQRHSDYDVPGALAWLRAWRRAAPTLAVGACLMGVAALALVRTAAPAESEEIIEGAAGSLADADNRGMSASNPRVKSMLAAHPHEFVTICVAGCDGKPNVVQALPMPLEKRSGAMRTTAADGRPIYGHAGAGDDAVICMAGCGGPPGQVVQRLPGLPPPKAPPAPREQGNEPLDVR